LRRLILIGAAGSRKDVMSRADFSRLPADGRADESAGQPVPGDSAKVAKDIGMVALDLAKQARAAGLTTIGYLLETVALEAGAEAATRQWPADISER
jgi:hypothetical protein